MGRKKVLDLYYVALGQKIRLWRIQNGMTQQEMADHLSYSGASSVHAIESGQARIQIDTLHLFVDEMTMLAVDDFLPSQDEIASVRALMEGKDGEVPPLRRPRKAKQ